MNKYINGSVVSKSVDEINSGKEENSSCKRKGEIKSKQEFVEKLVASLKDYFGSDCTIKVSNVCKNNGVKLTGITIMKTNCNISPTIYADAYFERYKNGEAFGNLVFDMINIYDEHKLDTDFNMKYFEQYENVKNDIAYKIISRERNDELLMQIPYVEYLDMAIVFYYMFDSKLFGNATILIRNEHLKMWGVTKEQIYNDAVSNTPELLPYDITNMRDIMRKMLFEKMKNQYMADNLELDENLLADMVDELTNKDLYSGVSMYVLSNTKNTFGAASILYESVLKDFAYVKDSNLIILPSSVHEVIIVLEDEVKDKSNLSSMVREINDTQIPEEEILSDSIYLFDKNSGEIRVVS